MPNQHVLSLPFHFELSITNHGKEIWYQWYHVKLKIDTKTWMIS